MHCCCVICSPNGHLCYVKLTGYVKTGPALLQITFLGCMYDLCSTRALLSIPSTMEYSSRAVQLQLAMCPASSYGVNLEPIWKPLGAQKALQEAHLKPKERPKRPKDAQHARQDSSTGAHEHQLGPNLAQLGPTWRQFGPNLAQLSLNLAPKINHNQ